MSRQSLEMSALRMWIIDFKTLELQRQIGEGSFGRVSLQAAWQLGWQDWWQGNILALMSLGSNA